LQLNRAWRDPITPQPDESIASIVVRLAPRGLVTVEQLLRWGLKTKPRSAVDLVNDRNALELLAGIGSFNVQDLQSRGRRTTEHGYVVLDREVPQQWLNPHKRRVAPGVLRDDGKTPFARLLWEINALSCDLSTGE
jgi:hypothetical protein